jgi:N-methylhydantoinase A
VRLADGRTLAARLLDAAALAPGDAVPGPALVEGYSSSTWVPEGWTARRDAAGNTLIARSA